jgi:hypothetical protein
LKKSIVAAAGLGVAAALSISAPASADPKAEPLQIICDNGTTYWAVDKGHGLFAPVHDVDSNSMLIPTSFGDFHGVITDSTGAGARSARCHGQRHGRSIRDARALIPDQRHSTKPSQSRRTQ